MHNPLMYRIHIYLPCFGHLPVISYPASLSSTTSKNSSLYELPILHFKIQFHSFKQLSHISKKSSAFIFLFRYRIFLFYFSFPVYS